MSSNQAPTAARPPRPKGNGAGSAGRSPEFRARRGDERTPNRRIRFEARRVRRLIRHIDPWSVLKASLIMFTCVWFICMVAGVMLWNVAVSSGTVEQIEEFMNSNLGLENWAFDGRSLFRQYGMIGVVMTLLSTGASVIATIIFNLISDIIGGVWVTVIEEESARPIEDSP